MNVLYGIILVNLLLITISVHGCEKKPKKKVVVDGNNDGTIVIKNRPRMPFQYLVGLTKESDGQVKIYCTGAIVRVPGYYSMVIANSECLNEFNSYQDIKLVKWTPAHELVFGEVRHAEVRDNLLVMSPSLSFINTTEYTQYYSRDKETSSHIVYVPHYNDTQLSVYIHPPLPEKRPFLEDRYCSMGNESLIPYDNNNTSPNAVKCYRQETSIQQKACNLNHGYLVVNDKFNVLFGIGLPLSPSQCYNRFSARYIRDINLTGIAQLYYYSAFPKITTSYTCMVVAFSAVVVL
ncbi:hypothetical protein QE152_g36634 [Popillia japonica]|uniref:Peptidase S1 domain-containing protein n=1 Tax=Popillia japonica TaxID=7064 RepID=A0AAW1ICH9_POPJA